MAIVGTVWAVVPGSIVVPPASLICSLISWISTTRALNSCTRELNSLIFAEIMFVCIITKVLAFSIATFLAVFRSERSVEEHPGDKVLGFRLVRIATMLVPLAGS